MVEDLVNIPVQNTVELEEGEIDSREESAENAHIGEMSDRDMSDSSSRIFAETVRSLSITPNNRGEDQARIATCRSSRANFRVEETSSFLGVDVLSLKDTSTGE